MQELLFIFNKGNLPALSLYFFIGFLSVIFAFLSQKHFYNKEGKEIFVFRNIFYIFSFLIAGIFAFIIADGNDFPQYSLIYQKSNWNSVKDLYIEPGYRILNLFLKSVIKNPNFGLGIIKLFTVALVYRSLYLLRKKINLGFAIMAYISLFYFEGLNLIRIYLAGAILLRGFCGYLENKKIYKYLIAVIIAISIHYTAIIGLYFILLINCYYNSIIKKQFNRFRILNFLNILLTISVPIILPILIYKISFLYKYANYLGNTTIGITQILYFIIPLIIGWQIYKYSNEQHKEILLIFSIFSFAIALLGYNIGILTRMLFYFSFPFLIAMPLYYELRLAKNMNMNFYFNKNRFSKNIWGYIFLIYFASRFILNLSAWISKGYLGQLITIF